jgi:hypothetical protein
VRDELLSDVGAFLSFTSLKGTVLGTMSERNSRLSMLRTACAGRRC